MRFVLSISFLCVSVRGLLLDLLVLGFYVVSVIGFMDVVSAYS